MRILVHDYAGHPFQVELSRSLARRGHDVCHVYSASNPTPQGALKRTATDSARFDCVGLMLPERIDKTTLIKRRGQEIHHGRLAAEKIADFHPQAVISANTPLDAQAIIQRQCKRMSIPFIYWVQDLLGVGTYGVLSKKLPVLGHAIGKYYISLEASLLRSSEDIVLISKDFSPYLPGMRAGDPRVHVIENWAPLADMPLRTRKNGWSDRYGLSDCTCFIYSGTLGMKHNPDLLLQLALKLRERSDVKVVVVSEGPGAQWLKLRKVERKLENLLILPFQPFAELPDVLGSADVLISILEPNAGVFSVPSKVLSYTCAGRPLLLAVPPENLAARIVSGAGAGLVVPPLDTAGFIEAAEKLLTNATLRKECGDKARSYAEAHFDIEHITDRFQTVLCPPHERLPRLEPEVAVSH
ncbi:MAG TPA: glycosyltransferase family 4 protein [Chthonomonadales bacterium]|nr:glycosyltransferase family 4 protein [Chthonomonadales bacterium]